MKGVANTEKVENQEIKQYLISFVEKTLNECEVFKKVYGADFVRKRLEINLEKVYTDISNNNFNTALYDMENSCITLLSSNNLTIADIENNKKLKHLILHESIHAIFKRTKEECQEFGIENGTGILEFYKNNQELGRGLNEGLTEWICQKAGYGEQAYTAEKNIIKILELAIGEDAVMQLANGDIKGNIAQLLQMNKVECLQTISLVDNIYQNEQRTLRTKPTNLDNEDRELDKSISHLESILFEKYFKDEIEIAQKNENISKETMQRLFELSFCINGGKTQSSEMFKSGLALKYKNEIYPQILKKQQERVINQRRQNKNLQTLKDKTDLPALYKKGWFQRLKEAIMERFIKHSNQEKKIDNQAKVTQQQHFKEYISDMSNYSKQTKIDSRKSKPQNELQINDEQEL